jgi:hypothetical protein
MYDVDVDDGGVGADVVPGCLVGLNLAIRWGWFFSYLQWIGDMKDLKMKLLMTGLDIWGLKPQLFTTHMNLYLLLNFEAMHLNV